MKITRRQLTNIIIEAWDGRDALEIAEELISTYEDFGIDIFLDDIYEEPPDFGVLEHLKKIAQEKKYKQVLSILRDMGF